MWRVRFDDGYNREVIQHYETKEMALEAACALRIRFLDLSIEGPGGEKYDEIAITDWCKEHGK
jgi:hypothetical protein